jgi:hypothetical protein
MPTTRRNVAVDRGNLVVLAAMSLLWLTPMLRFWVAVWGPLRPFAYPQEDVAPGAAWFLAGLAVCFLPSLLPRSYDRCWEGRRGLRFYEAIGVRTFKRYATNGDLINGLARRSNPGYRVIEGREAACGFAEGTRFGERCHLVLFLMGLTSAAFAVRLGWYGWAVGLSAGNVVFNLYAALLQRYNRGRLASLMERWESRSEV